MDHDFSGRTALITGAASGIGAACARWLDRHGIARLVLVDLDGPGLDALQLSCQVQRMAGDVSDPALWDAIEGQLARLDHAVINAGIANSCALIDLEFGEWRRILSVNLDGAFLTLRTALRVMKRDGGNSIVLTSSMVGIKPIPTTAAYGSSKAAIAHLARIAAAEHAKDHIRINAVAPGRVDTPIWTKTTPFQQLAAKLGSREAALQALRAGGTALGRFPSAEELAGQIGFLLSDQAWNITGAVLMSDGGDSL